MFKVNNKDTKTTPTTTIFFLHKYPTVICYLFKINTTAKSKSCSKLIIKNHHDVITNVDSNDNFRKNINFIRRVYSPMWTIEILSTARKVRVMKTPKRCLLPKNSHLKTMKIFHEEKTTESDKKPAFQLKMLMCETLQRHEQTISNS